ncbi:hypothetical protein BC937DRAFT_90113 [Endogone sp. FLAS-F59071]|nr:hypothetical protein BC937DRAFT_90113 [Endogone sp. FLAS-F59071]|eukprot:RUS17328.1 hypothetical protein BC937DRAFT_90113 [Endogone sp. FLAS-F59071]
MAARQTIPEPSKTRSKTTCRIQTCHRRTVTSEHKFCSAHMNVLTDTSDHFESTCKLLSTRCDGEYTSIIELSKRTTSYKSISDDFIRGWLKKNAEGVRVESIFEISHPKSIIADHDIYRKIVEQDGNFVEQGLAEGNERLLYHGTDQSCHITFNPKDTKFCGNKNNCAMCGLMMNSFDREFIGRNRRGHKFQRLGSGCKLTGV